MAIGIDARDGKVQVAGWTEDSRIAAIDLARRLQELGARLVIYTDIARDGVLEGPNIEATREMIENTTIGYRVGRGFVDSGRAASRRAESLATGWSHHR